MSVASNATNCAAGDASREGLDLPDEKGVEVPILGTYPGETTGVVSGWIFPLGDRDRWALSATESVRDFCLRDRGDRAVVASLVLEVPNGGAARLCACWSRDVSGCLDSRSRCVTNAPGEIATLDLPMPMTCSAWDSRFLEVAVAPVTLDSAGGCGEWTVRWQFSE
jgi:hypothetical protein